MKGDYYTNVRRIKTKSIEFWRLSLANYRKKQLKSTDFTVISNNCWWGIIYESYNLPKELPTVEMIFIAKDYVELLSNLKGYVNEWLTFINSEESRWKDMHQVLGDKDLAGILCAFVLMGKFNR